MKDKKSIPKFKNEAEERKFWSEHDASEYMGFSDAQKVLFSHLKPSTKTVSLRMPERMIEELRLLANKNDVPYQSLIKFFLAERIQHEMRSLT